MKKLFLLFLLFSNHLFAQSEKPIHEWYSMTATELIFSSGETKSDGLTLNPVVRFSAFLHLQFQSHYNFSNGFGLYTGLGSRNVGLINHFDFMGKEVSLKQRSYSLGVPLGLKFGNVVMNKYIALGAEIEWMFAYKRKVLYNGDKYKTSQWFSGDVNALNPSLFAELHFGKHSYIKGKYYLLDFLTHKDMSFPLPNTAYIIDYAPTESKMWYISIGTTVLSLKKKHATKKTV